MKLSKGKFKMKKKPDINIFLTVGLIIFIVIMLAYRFINRETGDVAMVAIDGTEKRYEISLEEEKEHYSRVAPNTVTASPWCISFPLPSFLLKSFCTSNSVA